ncbi:MAG: type VI secretion system tip protein VgrG [Pyrinomonadaceae bacterium]|nr:type VI secretion system tip protein VgrG [Pyrinomonadaceae bacterium]
MADVKAKQDDRLLIVEVASVAADDLLVTGFMGHEEVSSLFSFRLDLLSDVPEKIQLQNIVGKNVTIGLMLRDESYRHFNGFISRFSLSGRDEGGEHRFTHYRAEVVPWLWFLTRTADCRIFQDKTVPEIIEKIFKDLGFQDFRFDTNRTYTKWDYCVQYRETDFNFVSRLMEEEGIFYFFEHENGKHTLIMADATEAYKPCPNQSRANFFPEGGYNDREDTVNSWEVYQEFRPGKYMLRDYHFQMPSKNLEVVEPTTFVVGGNDKFEVYDYPGGHAQRFNKPEERLGKVEPEGRTIVNLRMEEEETPHLVHYGGSICRAFTAGKRFELVEPPPSVTDGPYLLTSVSHTATQPAEFVSGRGGSSSDSSYNNSFTCIPASVTFRHSRITPKAIVQGPQTAVVVGPKGEEIFTDKFGRVKVQFHWDREGKKDENSSCWLRVGQTWAGKRWGASFWPRIGQEVIVAFLEGDPDQPIIIGSVYNAEQMPPYQGDGPDSKHKNDNKLTGVKSNSTKGGVGFNEWRFDDTKDKEQIFIHAEHNMDVRVKNDSMESIGHNRHLTVGGVDKNGKKWGDQHERVYRDKHLIVDRNKIEQVGDSVELLIGGIDSGKGNWDISMKGSKAETIGGDDEFHLTGDRRQKIGGSTSLTVVGDQQEKVMGKHALESAQEIHLKAGMKVIIEAGVQLTIKGPGGFVDIGPTGVTIQGTMVLINSGGAAGSGSGSSPDTPNDAKEAQPVKPTAADNAKTGHASNDSQ